MSSLFPHTHLCYILLGKSHKLNFNSNFLEISKCLLEEKVEAKEEEEEVVVVVVEEGKVIEVDLGTIGTRTEMMQPESVGQVMRLGW